jgi:nucleoside-diphosphate-sugar epimerase
LRKRNEIEKLYEKIEYIDVVVHLAALISFDKDRSIDLIESNLIATYNLVYISDIYKVKKFIYLSSIPITDSSQFELDEKNYKDYPLTTYHFSKLIGEKFSEDPGLNIIPVIFRIASPISSNLSNKLFFPKIVFKAINNESIDIYGKGTRVQNYIHVLDIAQAIEKAAIGYAKGIYFLGGVSVSNIDLVKYIIDYTKSNSAVNYLEELNYSDDNVKWFISNKKAYKDFKYKPIYSLDSMIDLFRNELIKK